MFRVLFFDSGLGGTSVFSAVKELNPNCSYYYLFDNECFPYGNKDEDFIIKRTDEILEESVKRFSVSLIVVACNTASTIALPKLRDRIKIPIVGVVPAIKPAAVKSKSKIIGLVATPGTIRRAYTNDLIEKFAKDCKVLKIGTTDLVRLCERKMAGKAVTLTEVADVFGPWLMLKPDERPDSIVLGCTHFPLVKDEIGSLFPKAVLVDSGEAIGRRVRSLISLNQALSYEEINDGNHAFFTGDLVNHFGYENAFKRLGFKDLTKFSLK